MPAAETVAAPVRPRGADHASRAELEDIPGGKLGGRIDVDVGHLAKLRDAVVAHANPLGEPGKTALAQHPAAQVPRRLGERHPMTAPRERQRAFEAGRAGADDEHRRATLRPRYPLRMPAAAPFLHDGRVLRAAHRREAVLAGHADVAADALADLVEAALLDLPRQKRVGDRRAGGPDEVDDSAPDLREHGVSGEVNRPTPTTGFVVTDLTNATCGSSCPCAANREVAESRDQSLRQTSHRSGASACDSMMSRSSAGSMMGRSVSCATAILTATAQRCPTASRVSSSSSRNSRVRFAKLPPYSSVRSLVRREKNCEMIEFSCRQYR